MNILAEIAEKTKERIRFEQSVFPYAELRREAEQKESAVPFAFEKALKQKDMAFICEVKKASPSKGVIAEDFPYLQTVREYEEAGANAISCLTEPFYFRGSDIYLREICKAVSVPVLRKDFTVSDYMIYQAKAFGAEAVLLICGLLEKEQLKEYAALCDELKISALTEAHTAEEIEKALYAGARVIGVNNRDLKTFRVDLRHTLDLRSLVPDHVVFVSESGIKTPEDTALLRKHRVDAVLIGETLMRAENKKEMLQSLRGAYDQN